MRHEIKLVVLVFLLVVGPAVGLSFLTGRILGNWQVVLQKRMETAASAALESADAEWGGRLDQVRRDILDGLATQTPVRVSADCAFSHPWASGLFLFQRGRGLIYPGAAGQLISVPPREAGAVRNNAHFHGSFPMTAVSNRTAMIGEYRQVLKQPDLPADLACWTELQLAYLYQRAGQTDEARKQLLHVARPRDGRTIDPPTVPGQRSSDGWPRDPEEGFYYDLVALQVLAGVCREAGDMHGAREATGELMRRVLERYDEMAPLQRERVFAHVAASGVLADAAMSGGREPVPSVKAFVTQWQALLKACTMAGDARSKIEQEMGHALQSGLVTSNGWTRIAWGGHDFLLTMAPGAVSGGGLLVGLELDNRALESFLLQTGMDIGRKAGLTIRLERVDAAGRRVPPAHEKPESDGGGPLLAEHRLTGPLDNAILSAYPADAQAFLANARLQSRLYGWGGGVLVVSVLLGGWLVWREASGEIRRARERSEFAAAVSHDLRTPLASMRMLAESLHLGRIEDAEKRKRFLEIILKESDRLSRLTDRALYFIQYGQGALRYRMTEGDIAALVKDVVETFATGIEGKVRELRPGDGGQTAAAGPVEGAGEEQGTAAEWGIDLTLSHDVSPVKFDAGAMEQVIFNLLDNAVKYSRNRRRVEVRVMPDARGRHVVVSVRDFGVGIDPKDMRRIFNAYHRGKGSANTVGLGLGLALCRDIVKAHQGRIEVESAVDEGSTFRVTLPGAS